MPFFKSKSIGQYIVKSLCIFALIQLIALYIILDQLDWQLWNVSLALFIATIVIIFCIARFKTRVLASYNRALMHVEAIKLEDYNLHAKSDFSQGETAELHCELTLLSKKMQSHKSQYDQHAMLLYQLIDQLDTPMMVFNRKEQLTYANSAFSTLYGQPWQMFRFSSTKLLGLLETEGGWKLTKEDEVWHVSQSEFIDGGERHLLLVFTNIDSAIRASQLNAWQQIIRVMSHEIRNSLTPVSSLAESLANKLESPREQQALAVISERCEHLQDFVNRYSSLSQPLNLDIQVVDLLHLTERLKGLFSNHQLTFSNTVTTMWVDPTFFEQVLINLIKNAYDAEAKSVSVSIIETRKYVEVYVIDDGHGITNTQNLFVPLFTTKQQGQGIGLIFCRNIIEQHGGTIDLKNNKLPLSGMRAVLTLPLRVL